MEHHTSIQSNLTNIALLMFSKTFFKIRFILFYEQKCFACRSVCVSRLCTSTESEGGTGSPGAGVSETCEFLATIASNTLQSSSIMGWQPSYIQPRCYPEHTCKKLLRQAMKHSQPNARIAYPFSRKVGANFLPLTRIADIIFKF